MIRQIPPDLRDCGQQPRGEDTEIIATASLLELGAGDRGEVPSGGDDCRPLRGGLPFNCGATQHSGFRSAKLSLDYPAATSRRTSATIDIAAIGEDMTQPRKGTSDQLEKFGCTVAILYAGFMDDAGTGPTQMLGFSSILAVLSLGWQARFFRRGAIDCA